MAHDGVNFAAHSKDYTQVIVPPGGEAQLGKSILCKIVDQGRFFVRGVPIVVVAASASPAAVEAAPVQSPPASRPWLLIIALIVLLVAVLLASWR